MALIHSQTLCHMISMKLSVLYFKGSQIEFSEFVRQFCHEKAVFNLTSQHEGRFYPDVT